MMSLNVFEAYSLQVQRLSITRSLVNDHVKLDHSGKAMFSEHRLCLTHVLYSINPCGQNPLNFAHPFF